MKSISSDAAGWRWDHSYVSLPGLMFERSRPVPVREPGLAIFNVRLAAELGLDAEEILRGGAARIFAGNEIPEGADPIAQAYAGHQFGHFTGLGDGRAILLGEHVTPDGKRYDIQLKGSGRTAYSRGGDGRAALGPMLREYIISEAMHALGIPTTRSLAVATTGEAVMRSETLPGAVLTRVAASHIRVGTFQWAAAHEDHAALLALADYTRQRHFPEIPENDSRHFAFFEAVLDRQASLIAKWLHVGFIHGVMNTDNMALSGESIDYGPCAFMDAYDPATVFSSIDRHGRYAYGQQPSIARWNLARLAEAMLPLLDKDSKTAVDLANEALGSFEGRFQAYWLHGMRNKLGLRTAHADDAMLVQEFLDLMQANHMDFTQSFRALSHAEAIKECPFPHGDLLAWHGRWRDRLDKEKSELSEIARHMKSHNPAVIPRNHKVEEALAAATDHGDLEVMHRLLAALANPFNDEAPLEYTAPPPPSERVYQTFCGT
ncbi:MAG: YdiU family protein [Akkermansiaceae bacterium]|nr:YdiU family protein [Akkermansiaceae bacterium]